MPSLFKKIFVWRVKPFLFILFAITNENETKNFNVKKKAVKIQEFKLMNVNLSNLYF